MENESKSLLLGSMRAQLILSTHITICSADRQITLTLSIVRKIPLRLCCAHGRTKTVSRSFAAFSSLLHFLHHLRCFQQYE